MHVQITYTILILFLHLQSVKSEDRNWNHKFGDYVLTVSVTPPKTEDDMTSSSRYWNTPRMEMTERESPTMTSKYYNSKMQTKDNTKDTDDDKRNAYQRYDSSDEEVEMGYPSTKQEVSHGHSDYDTLDTRQKMSPKIYKNEKDDVNENDADEGDGDTLTLNVIYNRYGFPVKRKVPKRKMSVLYSKPTNRMVSEMMQPKKILKPSRTVLFNKQRGYNPRMIRNMPRRERASSKQPTRKMYKKMEPREKMYMKRQVYAMKKARPNNAYKPRYTERHEYRVYLTKKKMEPDMKPESEEEMVKWYKPNRPWRDDEQMKTTPDENRYIRRRDPKMENRYTTRNLNNGNMQQTMYNNDRENTRSSNPYDHESQYPRNYANSMMPNYPSDGRQQEYGNNVYDPMVDRTWDYSQATNYDGHMHMFE